MIKRVFAILFFFIMFVLPVGAETTEKFNAKALSEFTPYELPETLQTVTSSPVTIRDKIIPEGSTLTLKIFEARKELRWHKSGFFLCKILNYTDENNNIVDMQDIDIYFAVRRYEKIKTKDIVLTGTELTLSQAAAFFAPGVDILYFFTKGAIRRDKHPNWFKSGVFTAYDNSIFWFPQKGKNINLSEGDAIQFKKADTDEFNKLMKKSKKRRKKDYIRHELETTKNINKRVVAEIVNLEHERDILDYVNHENEFYYY